MSYTRRTRVAITLAALIMNLMGACAKPAPDPVIPAPPPVVKPGTTFTANPNPIVTEDNGPLGATTLNWSTTAKKVQIHIGGPDGKLFVNGGSRGSARTDAWVDNGMTFYLQDEDAPNPASDDATLGRIVISVQ